MYKTNKNCRAKCNIFMRIIIYFFQCNYVLKNINKNCLARSCNIVKKKSFWLKMKFFITDVTRLLLMKKNRICNDAQNQQD